MDIDKLTVSQLDKALSRADRAVSAIMNELIMQGRGHERISVIRAQSDPLSLRAIDVLNCSRDLHNEETRRLRYHSSLRRIVI